LATGTASAQQIVAKPVVKSSWSWFGPDFQQRQLGRGSSSTSTSLAAPEPNGLLLAALAMLGRVHGGRRREKAKRQRASR
jgi:hypothetical protein